MLEARAHHAGTITMGGPGKPIFVGSRVMLPPDDREWVVDHFVARNRVVLFFDNRRQPERVPDVDIATLVHLEFTVQLNHVMGVAATITAKGVPPVYGDKQLILVDGRARRFTTNELYRLGGDIDGVRLYEEAVPSMSKSKLRSKPGKSLQSNLAHAIVVRLQRRIRRFLDVIHGRGAFAHAPEVALAAYLSAPSACPAALVLVALNDGKPSFLPSLVNYEIRKAHSTASQALTTPSPFARARARD